MDQQKHIISSGCNTQLHSFDTLEPYCQYDHRDNAVQDFSHFSERDSLMVSVRKNSGFELIRLLAPAPDAVAAAAGGFQKLKKRRTDDIECVACSTLNDVAIGTTNGYIQFFNIRTADYTTVKFKPGNYMRGGRSGIFL